MAESDFKMVQAAGMEGMPRTVAASPSQSDCRAGIVREGTDRLETDHSEFPGT